MTLRKETFYKALLSGAGTGVTPFKCFSKSPRPRWKGFLFGESMGYIVYINEHCPKCKVPAGENYTTRQNGQHTMVNCGTCGSYVKFLSKEDKYNTKEQQRQIWQKTRGRCLYCGGQLEPFEKNGYCVEHLEPQILGGGHETENLYPCCKSCNSQKGGKTLEDYRAYKMREANQPKFVFYFEVLNYSAFGDLLKIMF